jgi:hypothetical protein
VLYRARAARPSMAKPPMAPTWAAPPVVGTLVVAVVVTVPLVGGEVTVGATVVSRVLVETTTTEEVVASAVVSSAVEVSSAVVVGAEGALVVVPDEPEPWFLQRASVAGRTLLMATSPPHLEITQLVALPWMALKLSFLQMQAKSVVSQVVSLETASWMQGRAHEGISARVWARATAARARATKAYFILKVLKVV